MRVDAALLEKGVGAQGGLAVPFAGVRVMDMPQPQTTLSPEPTPGSSPRLVGEGDGGTANNEAAAGVCGSPTGAAASPFTDFAASLTPREPTGFQAALPSPLAQIMEQCPPRDMGMGNSGKRECRSVKFADDRRDDRDAGTPLLDDDPTRGGASHRRLSMMPTLRQEACGAVPSVEDGPHVGGARKQAMHKRRLQFEEPEVVAEPPPDLAIDEAVDGDIMVGNPVLASPHSLLEAFREFSGPPSEKIGAPLALAAAPAAASAPAAVPASVPPAIARSKKNKAGKENSPANCTCSRSRCLKLCGARPTPSGPCMAGPSRHHATHCALHPSPPRRPLLPPHALRINTSHHGRRCSYCVCFAAGKHCVDRCKCNECRNTGDHEEDVLQAQRAILDRNSQHAFAPKVKRLQQGGARGCTCKNSRCAKNYCECFQAGVACDPQRCKCQNCTNGKPAMLSMPDPHEAGGLLTERLLASPMKLLDPLDDAVQVAAVPLMGECHE